jgi:hypothetical protein
MGMDFGTDERLDEVNVIEFDDLVQQEFRVVNGDAAESRQSWFSLLVYWVSELRWRVRYWRQQKG